ncbi:TIR-like protein FxsC [Streptomyces sp. NPDC086777]|uniref:TIR-like protein FxsC n=1 Tax=Streptomyces sp. NPDC086777 TaxID=3154866 RepID=UPI00344C3C22
MQPTEPMGADDTAPYFFLSYAHVPRDESDASDPDMWVHRLFRDLCEHIRAMTTVQAGAAGFMDRRMRAGQIWNRELANSLTGCRVFVPLYSPRYFISPWCGKEWTTFGLREARYIEPTQYGLPSAVVPALWVPVPDHRLPDCVREIQFYGPEHSARYRMFGLYGLAKLNSFRSEYQKAVLHLARRIVEVGESIVVQKGDPGALHTAQDAFTLRPRTRPTTGRRLRISVAAGSRRRLPDGRSPDYYGDTPLDWRPYQPEMPRPLGQMASDIAEELEFQADVQEFDHLRGPSDGPEVLLLDRWWLHDPDHRARLGEFDADDRKATGLVVPWNSADPDDDADGRDAATEVESALPRRTHRQTQAGRPTVLGPDGRSFSDEFPRVVHWAAAEYLKRAPVRTPPGDAPPRFRLGAVDSRDGRSSKGRGQEAGEEGHDGQLR